jgi:hypothetical protein
MDNDGQTRGMGASSSALARGHTGTNQSRSSPFYFLPPRVFFSAPPHGPTGARHWAQPIVFSVRVYPLASLSPPPPFHLSVCTLLFLLEGREAPLLVFCTPHLHTQLPPPCDQKATEVAWCMKEGTPMCPPSRIKPPQSPLVHISFRFDQNYSKFPIPHNAT